MCLRPACQNVLISPQSPVCRLHASQLVFCAELPSRGQRNECKPLDWFPFLVLRQEGEEKKKDGGGVSFGLSLVRLVCRGVWKKKVSKMWRNRPADVTQQTGRGLLIDWHGCSSVNRDQGMATRVSNFSLLLAVPRPYYQCTVQVTDV